MIWVISQGKEGVDASYFQVLLPDGSLKEPWIAFELHGGEDGMKKQTHTVRAARFTVVELICVIGAIAIIFGLLMPALSSVRGRTKRSADLAGIKQFSGACFAVASDMKGMLPPGVRDNGMMVNGKTTGENGDDFEWFNRHTWVLLRDGYGVSSKNAICVCWQAKDPSKEQFLRTVTATTSAANIDTATGYAGGGGGINNTYMWYYYANRGGYQISYVLGTPSAVNMWDRAANQVSSSKYILPTRTYSNATSRTMVTCRARMSASGWGSWMTHVLPSDGVSNCDTGPGPGPFSDSASYPVKFSQMSGINMGYIDGSARWVDPNLMGAFNSDHVAWYYYDTTL